MCASAAHRDQSCRKKCKCDHAFHWNFSFLAMLSVPLARLSPGPRFLWVFPDRWTLLRFGAESGDSFAVGKLCFLDASPFLQRGLGNFHVHGHITAMHF